MVAFPGFRFRLVSVLIYLSFGVFAIVAVTPYLAASTRSIQLAAQTANVINVALPLLAALGFFVRYCSKDIPPYSVKG